MQVVLLDKHGARPSDYFKEIYDYERLQHFTRKVNDRVNFSRRVAEVDAWLWLTGHETIAGGSGTLSNYAETHTLDGWNNKAAWPTQANLNLALCTVLPDSSKTGATITEANYTGYARVAVAAATWNAATAGGAGAASTTATNAVLTFANCTAGSSTIIGWDLADSASTAAGNSIWWGSATSTVISTTQTPATIASGGLTESLT